MKKKTLYYLIATTIALLIITIAAFYNYNNQYEKELVYDDDSSFYRIEDGNKIYIQSYVACPPQDLKANIITNNFLFTVIEVEHHPAQNCPMVLTIENSQIQLKNKSLITRVYMTRFDKTYHFREKSTISTGTSQENNADQIDNKQELHSNTGSNHESNIDYIVTFHQHEQETREELTERFKVFLKVNGGNLLKVNSYSNRFLVELNEKQFKSMEKDENVLMIKENSKPTTRDLPF